MTGQLSLTHDIAEMQRSSYLHLSASISFPGVSKQRRIMTVCCLTTAKASSSRRAWSSTGGGVVVILAARKYTVRGPG